jgi:hypothetical protein
MPGGRFYEVREAMKSPVTECLLARTKCSTTSSGATQTPVTTIRKYGKAA